MNKPNVLIWDIETGFNVAGIFELFPRNGIYYKNIINEKYIISAAFKKLGEGKVWAYSLLDDPERFKKDPTDDYVVVKAIHETLSQADAVVAHYGDKYDIKFVNTRSIYHGFGPLPPVIQIDTYKIAKAKFLFNSNRLNYIGNYLGLGSKISTNQALWMDCLRGIKRAVTDMVTYNKQDVLLLEKVYQKLAPYVPAKLNRLLFNEGDECCPLCGSENLKPRGWSYTRTRTYRRFKCGDCSHWSQFTRCETSTTIK